VHRSATAEGVGTYRVEPYVLAADIYSGSGIARRGGWTWYTGAAVWMHRAVLEFVLGIRVRGDQLVIAPCVPDEWPEFEVSLRLAGANYTVRMRRGSVESLSLLLDGAPVAGNALGILRDERPHLVELILPHAV
jgi:cyclic beta-1,2-glucan synthetase